MTDYDPRTATGIPTEPVGSLPRPSWLQRGLRPVRRGGDHPRSARGRAGQGGQGLDRAPGGDRDADHLRRRAALVELRDLRDHRHAGRHRAGRPPGRDGGQYFAIFADGHNRQLPRLTGGPFRYKTYAADTLKKSITMAHKPMKQAVIAPSMLALLYPLDEEIPGYSREAFEEDLVGECEKDIRQAFAAGAARVSVDFTEGRLATRNDPRNPWTGRNMLPHFIELNNRVMAGSPPRSGPGSACTPAPAATGTRCTAPTSPTATCCRRCSA